MLTKVRHQNEELLKLVRENRVRLQKMQLLVAQLRRQKPGVATSPTCVSTHANRTDKMSQ